MHGFIFLNYENTKRHTYVDSSLLMLKGRMQLVENYISTVAADFYYQKRNQRNTHIIP